MTLMRLGIKKLSFLLLAMLSPMQPVLAHELSAALLEPLLEHYRQVRDTLGNPHYIALINYRQPSWEPRFYLIDPEDARVIGVYRVAHGRGSDPNHDGFANYFSDRPGSHMSSVGFFITRQAYISQQPGHGLSLRLEGVSDSNRHAYERDIVIHANDYMERDFIKKYGMPGRSYGCMTLTSAARDKVIAHLAGGALIYATH